jgi:hypothetical protein
VCIQQRIFELGSKFQSFQRNLTSNNQNRFPHSWLNLDLRVGTTQLWPTWTSKFITFFSQVETLERYIIASRFVWYCNPSFTCAPFARSSSYASKMVYIHQYKPNTLATIITVVCRFRFPCRISFLASSSLATFNRKVYIFCWLQNAAAEKQQEASNPEEAWVCGSHHARIAVRPKVWAKLCWPTDHGALLLVFGTRLWLQVVASAGGKIRFVCGQTSQERWKECRHGKWSKIWNVAPNDSIFANFIEKTSAIAHDVIIWVNWNW